MVNTNIQNLSGLLASPPFAGIEVTESDHDIRITIRGTFYGAKDPMLLGLFGIPIIALSGIFLVPAFAVFMTDVDYKWAIIIPLGLVGLIAFFSAITVIFTPILVHAAKAEIVLGDHDISITEKANTIKIPWQDLRSVKVRYMKRAGTQALPDLRWPLRRGKGDGIVIETPHGTFTTLGFWHHEVSEWVAGVLTEQPGISRGDEPIATNLHDRIGDPGVPSRIDRKSLIIIGLLAPLLGGPFFLWSAWIVWQSWDTKSWPQTTGTIVSRELEDNGDRKDTWQVTYSYQVDGETLTSDRYGIYSGYSDTAEQHKSSLDPGDTVDVWYNPDHPTTAVLDTGFAVGELFISFLCLGVAVLGIGALIYGLFGNHNALTERYVQKEQPNPG